ncbi:peptide chain release factor N(5)-glutamine methyltransferase [Candidatus Falkowbacteria bacterium]|nr:peptide chain release factor N(5)-glutamine methyltransferase [Candidatus Falkowbacteria bacterium]
MTIKQIFSEYFPKLKHKSLSPFLDIEIILSKTLNKPKEYLYEYSEKKLLTKQLTFFKKLFSRRLKGEPIAYILGYKEFYNLNFKVNKNVLIPRPETEVLVDKVIKYCQEKIPNSQFQIPIIDIGTGSGCIIISLAKNIKNAKFFATEISVNALKVAKQNAKLNNVKINFLKGNLLEPITNYKLLITNYIIVANLPYLTTKEVNNPILKYEPKVALDGGQGGLKYFYELFDQIEKFAIEPKAIFLEIGYNQAARIKKIVKKVLPEYKFEVKKDLSGFDRVLKITK